MRGEVLNDVVDLKLAVERPPVLVALAGPSLAPLVFLLLGHGVGKTCRFQFVNDYNEPISGPTSAQAPDLCIY